MIEIDYGHYQVHFLNEMSHLKMITMATAQKLQIARTSKKKIVLPSKRFIIL